jgi:transcriptional regulator with XRE-family HTH domain
MCTYATGLLTHRAVTLPFSQQEEAEVLTCDYLNALKEKHGWTDYRIAKELGISHTAVSRYRNENSHFSDEIALRVAELLELHPVAVIADQHAARAKSDESRKFWKQLSSMVAGAILCLSTFAQPSDVYANVSASRVDNVPIMRNCRWSVVRFTRKVLNLFYNLFSLRFCVGFCRPILVPV